MGVIKGAVGGMVGVKGHMKEGLLLVLVQLE